MTNDRNAQSPRARLTANSAFVVHLAPAAPDTEETVEGRIEHVTSGRTMLFATSAELIGFMQQIVKQNG